MSLTLRKKVFINAALTGSGCTTPFKPPLKENIAALVAAHAHLPLPVGAGRSIGGR